VTYLLTAILALGIGYWMGRLTGYEKAMREETDTLEELLARVESHRLQKGKHCRTQAERN
jgi:hypothetical protein